MRLFDVIVYCALCFLAVIGGILTGVPPNLPAAWWEND